VSSLPFLGSGMGYRRELAAQQLAAADRIDVLEILVDHFLSESSMDELERVSQRFPLVLHGVGLSIGSVPLDRGYLRAVRRVSDVSRAPYYSEHLAVTRVPGIDLGHLTPVWFTRETLRRVIDNVHRVQETLGKPVVLENIATLLEIPGAQLGQPEFFRELVEATGCGVLLDVENLHLNAENHHFDPEAFLAEMPLESVVQIHTAGHVAVPGGTAEIASAKSSATGGQAVDGLSLDRHCAPVPEPVWALLDRVLERAPVKAIVLERDVDFPEDFEELLADVERARQSLAATHA